MPDKPSSPIAAIFSNLEKKYRPGAYTKPTTFYRKNAVKPCTLGQGYKAHAVLSSQTCDKIAV